MPDISRVAQNPLPGLPPYIISRADSETCVPIETETPAVTEAPVGDTSSYVASPTDVSSNPVNSGDHDNSLPEDRSPKS